MDDAVLMEWFYDNCKDEIIAAMTLRCVPTPNELQLTQQRLVLLDQIAEVQRQYLLNEPPNVVFGSLLTGLLDLMDSEYGFIGEKKYEEDGTVFLQVCYIYIFNG